MAPSRLIRAAPAIRCRCRGRCACARSATTSSPSRARRRLSALRHQHAQGPQAQRRPVGRQPRSNIADDVPTRAPSPAQWKAACSASRRSPSARPIPRPSVKWGTATHHGADVGAQVLGMDWPKNVFVNINFPDRRRLGEGCGVTNQGRRFRRLYRRARRYTRRQLLLDRLRPQESESTRRATSAAIRSAIFSVTPLHLDSALTTCGASSRPCSRD